MNFEKKLLIVRTYLDAKGYFNALRALEFAHSFHKGLRKDGRTPEFDHQLSMALHAMSLPGLLHPEAVYAAIFLHDVPEDYRVGRVEIVSIFTCSVFATLVVEAVYLLNKYEEDGTSKNEDALFAAMGRNAVASIVKGLDRSHNLSTMLKVFTPKKQISYCDFAENRILPMLKIARRLFPEQKQSCENLKHMIEQQIALTRAIHNNAKDQ